MLLRSLCRSRTEKRRNWCQRLRGSGKSKPTVIQMRWRPARNRTPDASNQTAAIAGLAPALPGNRWKNAEGSIGGRALVLAPGTLPLPEVIRADLLEGGIVLMCSAGQ
jgi:hypothetical protein